MPDNTLVNREKIIILTNNYILLLQKTINQKSGNYLAEIGGCFEDFTVNEHIYDLSNEYEKLFVGAYFLDAHKTENITQFDANTEDLEIVPCTYFNPQTSRKYAYVRLPKTVIKSGKTKTYSHILSIDITNNMYFIDEVFKDNAITYRKYIAPCTQEKVNTQKQAELIKITEAKYKNISKLYADKKYFEAIVLVEEVLQLNPSHVASIDAKNALLDLIESKHINNKIKVQLCKNNIRGANETFKFAKKHQIGLASEFTDWNARITKKEIQLKQEFEFKTAENHFENEMFQMAFPIYKKLQQDGYQEALLKSRIEICRTSDPEFIRKKIKSAYNAVLRSKKNAPETFKTYYKYENNGNLNGDNFRFMCQIMLSKGNKKLLRDMNITASQAKNLAINYFFKAKNLGKDMSDIEFMIFTKNFNKN